MDADEETNITDLELLPDGRIFVFGASREVLQILEDIQCATDGVLSSRLGIVLDSKSQTQFNQGSQQELPK